MSLTIDIDDPRPWYNPGSTISGNIILTSNKSEHIAHVEVVFTGRCKVKIRRHDHYTSISYRSRSSYFRNASIVYDGGNYAHQSGARSWPFNLTIPTHANLQAESFLAESLPKRQVDAIGMMQSPIRSGIQDDFFAAHLPWRGSRDLRPHSLPGTFKYVDSRWPVDAEGRVEYTLIATLKRPPGSVLFTPKDLEVSRSINIKLTTPLSQATLQSNVQTYKFEQKFSSIRLVPSKAEGKLSLRDRAQSFVRPASLPQFTVVISVILPRHLFPGAKAPFFLSIQPLLVSEAESKREDMPVLKVRQLALRLMSKTALRDNAQSAMQQTVERIIRLSGSTTKGLNLEVPVKSNDNEPLDLSSLHNLQVDGDSMVPGFSTYNIFREYHLGFDIKLECAGKTVDVNRDSIPVQIMGEMDRTERRATDRNGEIDVPSPAFNDEPAKPAEHIKVRDEKSGSITPLEKEEQEEQLPVYEPQEVPDYRPE